MLPAPVGTACQAWASLQGFFENSMQHSNDWQQQAVHSTLQPSSVPDC